MSQATSPTAKWGPWSSPARLGAARLEQADGPSAAGRTPLKVENFQKTVFCILYLFIAALAPAITFGSRFLEGTNGQFGVLEQIMSSAISGVLFATSSGRLGVHAGGFQMADGADLEFMPFDFWLFAILAAFFFTFPR